MSNTLPLEECSINQIYLDSSDVKTYMIPIYQRNYAWEEDEIRALIKDIHDSFVKDPKAPYYIGTLVAYKRGDTEYEVIDGQQRLTTIYIILKVLGVNNLTNKLTYSARQVSASTIANLDNYPNLGENVDNGIKNGYKYAENAYKDYVEDSEQDAFRQYFLNNVHLIRYEVPKDVDLNHYFEVMNSRGEQLEKHEIVKSLLSQYLDEKTERTTFSRVWEACSEMDMYIQQCFSDKSVFGNSMDSFKIEDFEGIPKQEGSEGKKSISKFLKGTIDEAEDDTYIERNDKFQPIIDFPNFLLIVLKLTRMGCDSFDPTDFTLDDKELLNEFTEAIKDVEGKTEFAKLFCFNLLKAKYFLDNYVVHHTLSATETVGDNPWKLQYYYKESADRQYPKNLSTDDNDVQKELVHLLSMFEVSFTPKQRKNYLFYCMLFLFKKCKVKDYLEFLKRLADKYFVDVYMNPDNLTDRNQPKPNAFDYAVLRDGKLSVYVFEGTGYRERFEKIYQQGRADIPLFVFNFTDYLIWRKYANDIRGEKTKKDSLSRKKFFNALGCSDFELNPFNNFYFSRTRKSLEHFYPQAKVGDDQPLTAYDINCFGNFAMIGADANSSGSCLDPRAKLDRYSDSRANQISVASLKFKIMMQMCKDNCKKILSKKLERPDGLEWNKEDMQTHQEKMLDIIFAGIK
ncbi:DUF262 domain-containing protein [Prevotella histicola]|uniref:GmrSD restriction endonucleases N-terminal domain-containing protein n=1 Tax=Prevotella histicola JCM 15637 = DNF00424 TaxID=1236504 RepID=A0AAW3FIE3_9BACT|nr:DUF262 domain-containing protein [Prevotella histicola]KGF29303.1 hypothetical protein HMPREF2132_02525 [Prevotella histicola JCM 15637 = DNF00424]